jgi:protein SCO1
VRLVTPETYRLALRVVRACLASLALLSAGHLTVGAGPKDSSDPGPAHRHGATYRGGLVTPPLPKPRFTLTDTAGARFDFWRDTQGYVTLLFFGYARCPDQCPLHMANIAVGLKKMPAALADQVKVVFVTTDPARDSPSVLRSWLDRFDEHFIGLTGSEATIEAAQRAARIPLARKTARAGHDYAVSHASFVLVYTKDNQAHLIYPSGVTPEDWVHDLPNLVAEVWSSR